LPAVSKQPLCSIAFSSSIYTVLPYAIRQLQYYYCVRALFDASWMDGRISTLKFFLVFPLMLVGTLVSGIFGQTTTMYYFSGIHGTFDLGLPKSTHISSAARQLYNLSFHQL
jgi:hypothetical protein